MWIRRLVARDLKLFAVNHISSGRRTLNSSTRWVSDTQTIFSFSLIKLIFASIQYTARELHWQPDWCFLINFLIRTRWYQLNALFIVLYCIVFGLLPTQVSAFNSKRRRLSQFSRFLCFVIYHCSQSSMRLTFHFLCILLIVPSG